MAQSFACGRGGRAPEPEISIGDTVARKSSRAITGEVVGFLNDNYGRKMARVKWLDTNRLGGTGFRTSAVLVSALVKVEAAQ